MFSTNLKYLRKLHGLDQQSFAKKINRSVSTVSEWESGKYTPKAGILADIANMFNVKLDDMMSKDLSIIKEDIFDNTISVMKLLNPDRQQNVYNYADNQLKEQNNTIVRMPRTQIKLLGAVSAGTGEELQDDITEVDYTGTVPEYDYALQVNGDSMEPLFTDQQIIFVKRAEEAFNGQIVIAYVDGKAYVKKYYCNGAKCELVSLNSKYNPIDVSGNESFKIKGVVVL